MRVVSPMGKILKRIGAMLPDVFGRRRIYQLEMELEEAQGTIEELDAEAGVVSDQFEKDCWKELRGLLDYCKFDWRWVGGDGVTAMDAAEHILRHIKDLEDAKERLNGENEVQASLIRWAHDKLI